MPLFQKRVDEDLIDRLEAQLEESRELVRRVERLSDESRSTKEKKAEDLQRQIVDLEITLDRVKEQHARETRDIEHKVGLARQRQTQELELARRAAVLEVKEQSLDAKQKAFEEQLKFMADRFEQELADQKLLVNAVLERLPTVTVDRSIEERRTTRRTGS